MSATGLSRGWPGSTRAHSAAPLRPRVDWIGSSAASRPRPGGWWPQRRLRPTTGSSSAPASRHRYPVDRSIQEGQAQDAASSAIPGSVSTDRLSRMRRQNTITGTGATYGVEPVVGDAGPAAHSTRAMSSTMVWCGSLRPWNNTTKVTAHTMPVTKRIMKVPTRENPRAGGVGRRSAGAREEPAGQGAGPGLAVRIGIPIQGVSPMCWTTKTTSQCEFRKHQEGSDAEDPEPGQGAQPPAVQARVHRGRRSTRGTVFTTPPRARNKEAANPDFLAAASTNRHTRNSTRMFSWPRFRVSMIGAARRPRTDQPAMMPRRSDLERPTPAPRPGTPRCPPAAGCSRPGRRAWTLVVPEHTGLNRNMKAGPDTVASRGTALRSPAGSTGSSREVVAARIAQANHVGRGVEQVEVVAEVSLREAACNHLEVLGGSGPARSRRLWQEGFWR